MSAPEKTLDTLGALIDRFALTSVGDDSFIGWHKELPIAITVSCSHGTIGETGFEVPPSVNVLAQLRYVGIPEDAVPDLNDISDPAVQELIDTSRVRISFEETIAYLTAFETDEAFLADGLPRCFDAMLDVVKRAGGTGNGNTCHYCKTNTIQSLTWIDDRVAQVCDHCMSEKLEEAEHERRGTLQGRLLTLLSGFAATIFGAAAWASLWYLDFVIVRWMTPKGQTVLQVSHFVLLGEIFAIGLATGLLIGWIVSIAPKAGRLVPRFVAVLASIGAAILGDAATIKWAVEDEIGTLTFFQAVGAVPWYWLDLKQEAAYRLVAILIACMFAALMAAPLSKKSQ